MIFHGYVSLPEGNKPLQKLFNFLLFFWGDSSGKVVRIPMMCGLLIPIRGGLSGPSNHQPNPIQLGQSFHLKGLG